MGKLEESVTCYDGRFTLCARKKGTKVLFCFLVLDIGDQITPPMPQEEINNGTSIEDWRHKFWGWDYSLENRLVAVEKYANALCDTIESIIMMGSILMLNRMYSIRFLPIRNFGKITVK